MSYQTRMSDSEIYDIIRQYEDVEVVHRPRLFVGVKEFKQGEAIKNDKVKKNLPAIAIMPAAFRRSRASPVARNRTLGFIKTQIIPCAVLMPLTTEVMPLMHATYFSQSLNQLVLVSAVYDKSKKYNEWLMWEYQRAIVLCIKIYGNLEYIYVEFRPLGRSSVLSKKINPDGTLGANFAAYQTLVIGEGHRK